MQLWDLASVRHVLTVTNASLPVAVRAAMMAMLCLLVQGCSSLPGPSTGRGGNTQQVGDVAAGWPAGSTQLVERGFALAQALALGAGAIDDDRLARELSIDFGPRRPARPDQQGLAYTRDVLPQEGLGAPPGTLSRFGRSTATAGFQLLLRLPVRPSCVAVDTFAAHAGPRFRYLPPRVLDRGETELPGPFIAGADAFRSPGAFPGAVHGPYQAEGLPLYVHVQGECIASIQIHSAR